MRLRNITASQDKISEYCRRWQIAELAIFGSALRDDFRPDSDIDVLVTFSPEARWTLLDFVAMQDELSALLGRQVDLVMRDAVEKSRNARRRSNILESARIVYGA